MRARNISIHVAYGSALPLNPSTTIHGRPIPPGYTSITVEQIVGRNNENLELDFVGGDGEKALRDALHEIILWCKDDIKLIGDTAAPVDPPFPPHNDNDDRDPSPQLPSPPSSPGQRARSTPTPPSPEKNKRKTSSIPSARPTYKKQEKEEKKKGPKKNPNLKSQRRGYQ